MGRRRNWKPRREPIPLNGDFHARIDEDVFKVLAAQADEHERSINRELNVVLREALGVPK